MNKDQSAIGGQSQHSRAGVANYGQSPASLFSNPDLKMSQDLIVIGRGSDGKPALWATGDPATAKRLFEEASQVFDRQAETTT